MRIRIAVTLGLAAISPAYGDVLILDPDPGTLAVSTVQTLTYPEQGMQSINSSGSVDLRSPSGASPFWNVALLPPTGQSLVAGCYERTSGAFGPSMRPRFSFGFNGAACSDVNARFKVLELQRQGSVLQSFAADFAVICGPQGKAVRGRIRYNSSVPTDTPLMRPAFDVTGTMAVTAAPGAMGGGSQGSMRSFTLSRQNIGVQRNFDQGVSAFFRGLSDGGSTTVSWALNFAGPDEAPLVVQAYPDAMGFPFQTAGRPGLDYTYAGASCNQVFGAFSVSAISYDAFDGIPIRFAASFDHRCEAASGPLATGTLTYDLNPIGPTTLPNPDVIFSSGFEVGATGGGFYTATCDL